VRTFVIGDIHGQVYALEECLELSGFDNDNDRLICLGDVCDRGIYIKESFDLLTGIKNLTYILGNHDIWFLDWAVKGEEDPFWYSFEGVQTVKSYKEGIPQSHLELLNNAKMYHIENNKLFVHAGFDLSKPLNEQSMYELTLNRGLIKNAMSRCSEKGARLSPFDEIYVGHTPTVHYGTEEPINACELWMLDTGAGWGYKLTIMDIETKEFWQSGNVK
jgi:serine/threonine protein phosphatase 1